MDKQNKGGRPKSYSVEQLDQAIQQLEARAESVTADAVKSILCEDLGVSRGINLQSLEAALERQVEVREVRRLHALRPRLPSAATAMAVDFAETAKQAVLDTLAQQYEDLRQEADKQVEAKELDNVALRGRVHDLTDDVASRDDRISSLDTENEELQAAISALEEQKAALEARLDEQGRDDARMEEVVQRMVAKLNEERSGAAEK